MNTLSFTMLIFAIILLIIDFIFCIYFTPEDIKKFIGTFISFAIIMSTVCLIIIFI